MTASTRAPFDGSLAGTAKGPADIPALTGLRVVAALAVVLYHLRGLTSAIAPSGDVVAPLLEGGMLGVDVFFVLSGFVIAHTYAPRLTDRAPGALRDYLVARVARIYPLHLVTFLAVVVLLAAGAVTGFGPNADAPPTVLGLVGNLVMLQALPGIPAWNLPAWSITCELAAYLVFPLVAARVLRVRWGTAVVVAAVAVGLQLVAMALLSDTTFALEGLFWPRIAGEFTAGAMAWVVWRQVLRPGRWADVAVLLVVAGAVWALWNGWSWLLVVPLLVVLVPLTACASGPVATVLAHPVTRWGGRISYALYLVHVPVLTALLTWVVPAGVFIHPSDGRAVLVLGLVVVVSLLAAALLHHGVEEPARRLLRRRFARPARPGSGQARDGAAASG